MIKIFRECSFPNLSGPHFAVGCHSVTLNDTSIPKWQCEEVHVRVVSWALRALHSDVTITISSCNVYQVDSTEESVKYNSLQYTEERSHRICRTG
jgi:hypothetical protein